MTDEPVPVEDAPVEVPAAPRVPWTIELASCVAHFTPLPNGGMVVHLTPFEAVPTQQGVARRAVSPRVDVPFGPEGWESFQRLVAANGVPELPTPKIHRPGLVVARPTG